MLSFDFIFGVILILLICSVIGAIIALIPFQKRTFKNKFKFSFISLLGITITFYGYYKYLTIIKGVELNPIHKYEDIQIPKNLNCSTIHEGKFETKNSIINRTKDKQIEKIKETGIKTEFSIKWINDCEYVLIPTADTTNKLRVKITTVNSDSYGCYIIGDRFKDTYPIFMSLKNIK